MSNSEANGYPRTALRVKDACASLSIGRTTIYEEIAAGRLKAVKCGSRTLIPATEINAWLERLPAKAA